MMRRLLAEGLGSLLLAATVIGSGIMAERLANGNLAVALIANTGATVAVLASVQALRGVLTWREASAYVLIQVAGCCSGAVLAHAMFDLPLIQASLHARTGLPQWLGEAVATFGLLLIILGVRRSDDAPWMVAAWIGAAYWFTSSTSFANPAITIARSLSNTFAGIAPAHVPGFIVAQLIGALAAIPVARLLQAPPSVGNYVE
jgi:glycerol uptake facilitator-like aquaporin